MDFKIESPYQPAGDQPQAIAKLTQGILDHKHDQILMGVTGSGKTFTLANVIANLNRPTLVIAHNKTLAAQLCSEFREFFPHNAVEYFVSYYDYYQPEAYIASRDIYIEKEADINEEIEKLRHRATRSLLLRKDVIIVSSVSCIYGLGTPEEYIKGVMILRKGDLMPRHKLLYGLEQIQYERNDIELKRGRYRVKGDIIDIFPSWSDTLVRLDFFGDELENIYTIHPVSGEIIEQKTEVDIYPATHYVVLDSLAEPIAKIQIELAERLTELKAADKIVEAQRLEQRTKYDIDMMLEMGYCKGIENYSRHISGRPAHTPGGVLLDFFPRDYITIIDESHATIPQVRGMYGGDHSRKKALIEYGFRLPSAFDNRPLKFDEFEERVGYCIYTSATPGVYELEKCRRPEGTYFPESSWSAYDLVEQVIRPTGLIDPEVTVKPSKHQIDDLFREIQRVIDRQERVLISTLTKKMSEELCEFLDDKHIKTRYLHSEILALDRIDILHDLRAGKFDVLVGVNLLREGLDLPEVSLVAILDADKEGFLRNERSLIQTMGRAARNINGRVVLYADKITDSMDRAIAETIRRRTIQSEYNRLHNSTPKTITKKLHDIRDVDREAIKSLTSEISTVSVEKLPELIKKIEKEMREAAKRLEFETAAVLRDQLQTLQDKLAEKKR